MNTTPLPPLPKEFVSTNGLLAYYTVDQLQAYAQQARADLEAENKRLREALQEAAVHIAARWGDSDPHAIKAFTALEQQP